MSLAGKTTAISEFISEVAVLMHVIGVADKNSGFKVFKGEWNLPPRDR